MSRSKRRKTRQHRGGSQTNSRKQARAAEARPPASAPESPPTGPSTVVALEPLAPLIVRSGRPFDALAGVDEARFPPPSTAAGCLRTAWARSAGQQLGGDLATLAVHGPLLLDRCGHPLVPKPADAAYFGADSPRCVRSQPTPFETDCHTDLPSGLLPLRLTEPPTGKPVPGPAWWAWRHMLAFRRGQDLSFPELAKAGWAPAAGDRRTHVAIDRGTGAAAQGKLFQTEGLVLEDRAAYDAARNGLRLLARFDKPMDQGVAPLGGERRLAALAPQADSAWPAPPEGWLQDIANAGGLCLTLLTPGIFAEGFRPGWAASTPPGMSGLRLQLLAAAVEGWQPQSGWDLAEQQPRPTRKAVPAGTTYWFRIVDGADEATLRALWLANVSDSEQDRRDGFGLALPSPWVPPAP